MKNCPECPQCPVLKCYSVDWKWCKDHFLPQPPHKTRPPGATARRPIGLIPDHVGCCAARKVSGQMFARFSGPHGRGLKLEHTGDDPVLLRDGAVWQLARFIPWRPAVRIRLPRLVIFYTEGSYWNSRGFFLNNSCDV